MSNERLITVIPQTITLRTSTNAHSVSRRHVAAYARVSTDSEEQQTSYAAQVDYYTKYIKEKPEWEFISVYTDEGISAVNTKHREGFNRMIADALAGKIDLIVTKSVSRFARNTVDSLVTVRKLKEKGVEVYFEKENIYTLDSKGELLITIMSSLAQEESRSISENVTWGQRKRFADGKVSLPYKSFLGYERGEDGLPRIVEKEAEVVRQIYRLFMQGKTPSKIATILTEQSISTPTGKEKWQGTTVESILTNEKYKGSALLQKKFTVDFLTKKQKINEGEVPQYFVEKSHNAIIEPLEFDMVQAELARRKELGKSYSCNSIFSSKIVCGECGEFYGSKVWHSNSKYKRTIWQCNSKFKGDNKCHTPHLYEDDIKAEFIKEFNKSIKNKEEILENCRLIQSTLTDCTAIDFEIENLLCEIDVVTELTRKLVDDNSCNIIDQNDYISKYDSYVKRYETAKAKLEKLQSQRQQRLAKHDSIGAFMFELSEQDEVLNEFDERLFGIVVERIMVRESGLEFEFNC